MLPMADRFSHIVVIQVKVCGAAYAPDGTRIVTGSSDHTVQMWDASDGGQVITNRSHTSDVLAVGRSPDGTRIASASLDGTV